MDRLTLQQLAEIDKRIYFYEKWPVKDPVTLLDHKDREALRGHITALENEDRPQYCICNKHPWLTAISKRATFECPACRVTALEAKRAELVGYAVHKPDCIEADILYDCNCGLDELLKQEREACEHGKGPTDYCEPCGRINGG